MTNNFEYQDLYQKVTGNEGVATVITNKASGGSIGSAATTVDVSETININQTTSSQTLTLPNPTDTGLNTSLKINNVGSASFTILSTVLQPGSGILVNWTGAAYSVIGTSSGATNVTVVGGKTFTVDNTLELAGTDSTVMTFPSSSQTIVGLTATQTLTNKTLTSPVLTTPTLGVASATTVNKVTLTAPATGSTLTVADGKTLTASNTLTLAGTDGTVMTFPSTSATIARTDAANTFTGVQTMTSPVLITPAIGVATGTSLTTTGILASTGTAGIGYATGAGGTVTQGTDKSTTVVLNKVSGAITTNNASLAASASVSFTLTNSTIAATDVVLTSVKSGASTGLYTTKVTATGAGSCQITISNIGSTASEAVVINFIVFKAVAA